MSVNKGFTLLELMIAIFIFAMISTAAYKLLNSVTHAKQVTDGLLDSLDELQRSYITIEKDFSQIIGRSIRDEFGDKQSAVLAPSKPATLATYENGYLIEFTRAGWRNPLGLIRSDLQRVAYALEDSKLVRYYWPVLDRASDPELIRQIVLHNVLGVKIRLMDEKKVWKSSWPPATKQKEGDDKNDRLDRTDRKDRKDRKDRNGRKDENSKEEHQSPMLMPAGVEIAIQHDTYGLLEFSYPLITIKSASTEVESNSGWGIGDKARQSRNSGEGEY
ncbi:MAG: type II secretion system minor pseudopilin GspJ [Candidatus Endonucleobacter bathymodioli]|uniref:Type II secretion system protein J n=1 Tax=Candidatus Endonucleibacter bathymodioli TaxID=539814 RepID=A0AA90SSK6_9GAMM|nr:type II secretion system minor pseudopilin GspJ [Candidatus Endonucleobacter bathymodioli]